MRELREEALGEFVTKPKPAQRKWEKQKPKAEGTERPMPPRIPMNVFRRPPRLPPVAPLTDRDREAA